MIAYQPHISSGWNEEFRRACDYEDDRHLAKLISGIATATLLIKDHSQKADFRLKGDGEFLKIAHMGKSPYWSAFVAVVNSQIPNFPLRRTIQQRLGRRGEEADMRQV